LGTPRIPTRYWLGKTRSVETNKKISQSMMGHKISEATKSRIREKLLGENNPNWKGGLYSRPLNGCKGSTYRNWRKDVFKRDDFTCQMCEQVGGKLHAHHIKSWIKHPKLRFDVTNGLTLCEKCHKNLHSLYSRINRGAYHRNS